jgi:DNA mismatch repair protein MutL
MEPPAEAPWRIVGEVLKTYIICEDAHRTVWLIDKHAAHERIRFDALKANTEPMMSQLLLTPLTVDLDADSCAAALENLAVLEQFGFVCEDFGGGTLLVRQIPADIRLEDAAATVEELARKLALGRADPAGARDELLHTVACKSAIKAGMDTSPAEMAALVKKVQSGEIQYCPHGRPVKYRLTEYDIEKMFKRA